MMLGVARFPLLRQLPLLCATAPEDDIGELQEMLRPISSEFIRAFTCEQAIKTIRANRMPVVICTESLGDSDWRGLLGATEEMSLPPSVIVIRSSPNAALWAEVLMAGGFDVVPRPLQFGSLLSAVMAGWKRWDRKREIMAAREQNLCSIHKHNLQSELDSMSNKHLFILDFHIETSSAT